MADGNRAGVCAMIVLAHKRWDRKMRVNGFPGGAQLQVRITRKFRLSSIARLASLAAVVSALALAPSAAAQSSSVQTYGGKGGDVQAQVGAGERAQVSAGGGLPFTGLDLALMAGGGLVLLLVGASLAKFVPRERS